MRKKIIAYNRLEKPVLEALQRKYDVRFFKNIDTKTDPGFLEFLHETEGIIGLELVVDRELLERAPNLKIVSNVSVGYNNLDLEQLSMRNIMATNTPDVLTDTVADTIFGILIATARRIPELDQLVKNGEWKQEAVGPEHFGTDVHHKTIGIIGMGRIGKAIAQRARFGFNMDILYYSRTRKPDVEDTFAASYCSLDTLLSKSDFVCLITPLTPETKGMIGRREFQLMKKSSIFINGSRGKTVVERELIHALQNGEIAAAGLDVFETEPVDVTNPLLQMKNVVTTPHIGSSTFETELKMSELAAYNLEEGLNDRKPPNLIEW
ncbi:bifunctional glyoxylate/hydroxypyruvate reductase B [Lentibacillus populi]|uniref:Bifunctional glyoxylate/hydroxypyruvate reductase B n=1 Tax=Lentibacillus populi TaxID=1827502 RepID=A0A9W5U2Z8_9BACI|nr:MULTISPECIES: D-glycerate dehydrogenase [Bacillaceae]MBT2215659.1 D-glycerate dehydrogenase [Virgibacillus dakarensis]GGB62180.1 bifunctional glyoxylate/hydroxypyruvate reductase B [Lentibacillus populi]